MQAKIHQHQCASGPILVGESVTTHLTFLVQVGEHNNLVTVMLPDHAPEVAQCRLHGTARRDELSLLLVALAHMEDIEINIKITHLFKNLNIRIEFHSGCNEAFLNAMIKLANHPIC